MRRSTIPRARVGNQRFPPPNPPETPRYRYAEDEWEDSNPRLPPSNLPGNFRYGSIVEEWEAGDSRFPPDPNPPSNPRRCRSGEEELDVDWDPTSATGETSSKTRNDIPGLLHKNGGQPGEEGEKPKTPELGIERIQMRPDRPFHRDRPTAKIAGCCDPYPGPEPPSVTEDLGKPAVKLEKTFTGVLKRKSPVPDPAEDVQN